MEEKTLYIVINRKYGGFCVPADVCAVLGCSAYPNNEMDVRTNRYFIEWVRVHPETPLRVARIPAEATHYKILEYDGFESIIMCVNGRLEYAEVE